MIDVTGFLLRWLYLCNLVRDIAEIQTLPYSPIHVDQYSTILQPTPPQGYVQEDPYLRQQQQQHLTSGPGNTHAEWKDQFLRGIISYPPGTQRLYAIDALRLELIQKFAKHLRDCDTTLSIYAKHCRHREAMRQQLLEDADPYLDADLEIVRAFERATMRDDDDDDHDSDESTDSAVLIISKDGTNVIAAENESNVKEQAPVSKDGETIPTQQALEEAYRNLADFRDYLPQLVASVLKSPPAFQPSLLDPIQKLRRFLLTRCLQDANWGIELCWLLEAEVGRAWKTLFEHRQQTGKRLIVVLPAEKAAVLAKIGMEKRDAFDLLQDAEQATAYGYTIPSPTTNWEDGGDDSEPKPARLPSSLSLRRCSHFGDTMHFIDRLTQISMDLRMVPQLLRGPYLEDRLNEINRRLRRRMVTRGDVSLDVEDGRASYDWPHNSDISLNMLKHSVHFPLEPKRVIWQGTGDDDQNSLNPIADRAKIGVMRVLNIVTADCRILSSRERCPYLVHVEVAETGLEGSDARLYASGSKSLGTTVEESLGIGKKKVAAWTQDSYAEAAFPTYKIPCELLITPIAKPTAEKVVFKGDRRVSGESIFGADVEDNPQSGEVQFPSRGGYQSDEFYQNGDFIDPNPYDVTRQYQYEQLHQHLHAPHLTQTDQVQSESPPFVTTRQALLEKVYGLPWKEKCEQVRQTSPYGKVKGWRLASFIMKAGEDIRQEALVMQVISKLNDWFKAEIPEAHRPCMRPYSIMCVGGDAGLIECLTDAKSVDEVKKRTDNFVSLRDYFERAYGPPRPKPSQYYSQPLNQYHMQAPTIDPGSISFEEAQDNFLRSLVGYSLVCYILQIKDRHNANILMDREGRIMHIDFGYVLGDTPKMGKVPIFSERAPFKLSADFWEVLGGWNFNEGGLGVRFCKMFELAFATASTHCDEITNMVEIALLNINPNPNNARMLANGIRSRLRMRGPPDSVEQKTFVMDLVNTALTSWGTSTYDWLQKNMNGYQ
jgi:phosphatidylinositol 4-kinase